MAEREKELIRCPKCGEKMYVKKTWFSGPTRKQRIECDNKHRLTLDVIVTVNKRSLRNLLNEELPELNMNVS